MQMKQQKESNIDMDDQNTWRNERTRHKAHHKYRSEPQHWSRVIVECFDQTNDGVPLNKLIMFGLVGYQDSYKRRSS